MINLVLLCGLLYIHNFSNLMILRYVCTQLPGGMAAERYGGKLIFGLGVLVTSVFTILTPLAARGGFVLLIICR